MPNFMDFIAAGLTGAATRDPLAYKRMLMSQQEQNLNNLYRKFMMDRMAREEGRATEQEELGKRPWSSFVEPVMKPGPPTLNEPTETRFMGRPHFGTETTPGVPTPTGMYRPRQNLNLNDLMLAAKASEALRGPEPKVFQGGPGTQFFQGEPGGGLSKVGEVPPTAKEPTAPTVRTKKRYDPTTQRTIEWDETWINGQWVPGEERVVGEAGKGEGIKTFEAWQKDHPRGTYTQFRQWEAGLSKTGEGGQKPLGLKDFSAEDARIRDDARQNAQIIAAKEGYGKLVQTSEGNLEMRWLTADAPQKFQKEMDSQYKAMVKEAQRRGVLPKDWIQETPAAPTISADEVKNTIDKIVGIPGKSGTQPVTPGGTPTATPPGTEPVKKKKGYVLKDQNGRTFVRFEDGSEMDVDIKDGKITPKGK